MKDTNASELADWIHKATAYELWLKRNEIAQRIQKTADSIEKIADIGLRLGEGCLTDAQFSHEF